MRHNRLRLYAFLLLWLGLTGLQAQTTGTFKDSSNGDVYKWVKIGNQVWMAENLNVDNFRNGDPIPEAKTKEEWRKAAENKQPAWCYYDNDPANGAKYGKLYNFYAVNDPRGLAPKGWHVPNAGEWDELTKYLGGLSVAAGKLKATTLWNSPNSGATNETGFAALPGGYRLSSSGEFLNIGNCGYWRSSTEIDNNNAWSRGMFHNNSGVQRHNIDKGGGFSVRCVRD